MVIHLKLLKKGVYKFNAKLNGKELKGGKFEVNVKNPTEFRITR